MRPDVRRRGWEGCATRALQRRIDDAAQPRWPCGLSLQSRCRRSAGSGGAVQGGEVDAAVNRRLHGVHASGILRSIGDDLLQQGFDALFRREHYRSWGRATWGARHSAVREEDVLDGVQEFGAADEAVPVQCPVDAQTRVCESSRSGRRSASYDASTKEQNPKGGARNGCMPNASQPISAEISPVSGACHHGGARDGSPRNLYPTFCPWRR